jgi:hypothetical protein
MKKNEGKHSTEREKWQKEDKMVIKYKKSEKRKEIKKRRGKIKKGVKQGR